MGWGFDVSWTGAWVGLAFPLAVGLVLTSLYAGPYRRLCDPNVQFRRTRRPRSLARSLTAALVVGCAVYALLLTVRIRLLLLLFPGLVGPGSESHAAGWLATAFLAVILVSEFFVVLHLLFYLHLCRDGVSRYARRALPELPADLPAVVVLIPACDELPETLERPLGSLDQIQYRNCHVILVENSRDPERKRTTLALAQRYGVSVLQVANRGTKAAALNDVRDALPPETRYLSVLDADQRIEGDFVSDLVALLEAHPEEGWVQTPQSYEDGPGSILRTAAAQQLIGLSDGTLQGKDVRGACPLLGTNYLLRLRALDEVGGWTEGFVNEDTPTSYRMQLAGWRGRYQQHVYATGLAPPGFGALWRQQARWSLANTKLFFSIVSGFFSRRRRPTRVVTEYLAYVSYELLTFLIAILALLPTVALVVSFFLLPRGDVLGTPLGIWQWAFVSLYPFHVLLLFFPQINMGLRGYPARNLVLVQGLVTCLGSAYLNGVRRAVFGARAIFESSTRGGAPLRSRAPRAWWRLVPPLLAFGMFLGAGAASLWMVALVPTSPFPWIVLFWSGYNAVNTGHAVLFLVDDPRARERRVGGARAL